MSEDNTFNEIKNGNVEAFKLFFESIYHELYFYCRKFILNPNDAKDLLQDVFLRLWENRSEVDIYVSLKSYVFRSVHNECINYLKRKTPEFVPDGISDISDYNNTINSVDNPYSDVLVHEIERTINESVEQLPEQCKTIFMMSRFEGMPNKEIAEKMQISVRTVETQIYRALKILKAQLKDYLY
jgi:RNA polymerase sigma-70 factor (ECF subfamily)